ncbi:hypothetical protein [Coralliovum pocilloporae]|uniref:hypothetical protein n=1 Tax=Coralliovum pocilloporae TaxID=3066369 RepID=UPI00330729D1
MKRILFGLTCATFGAFFSEILAPLAVEYSKARFYDTYWGGTWYTKVNCSNEELCFHTMEITQRGNRATALYTGDNLTGSNKHVWGSLIGEIDAGVWSGTWQRKDSIGFVGGDFEFQLNGDHTWLGTYTEAGKFKPWYGSRNQSYYRSEELKF